MKSKTQGSTLATIRNKIKNIGSTSRVKNIMFLGVGVIIGLSGIVAANPAVVGLKNNSNVQTKTTSTKLDCEKYLNDKAQGRLVLEQPSCDSSLASSSDSPTTTSSSTTPNQASNNSTKASTPTTSSLVPASESQTSSNTTTKCNETLKQSASNYRDSSIVYENSIHNSWRYAGPQSSSYRYDAEQQENTRHEAELARIEQQYQRDLSAANCNS